MAHIKGEKPQAARYDPDMTDEERSSYDNRILLCKNHHKMVDDQPDTYTVEILHQIKNEHEAWVRQTLEAEVVNVTFAELSVVTCYLVSGQASISDSYTIVPPKEKIQKNKLSSVTQGSITMGMTQVKQVRDFITKCPDLEFGERLKQGFVDEYKRLRDEEKLVGDELFDRLLDFACQGFRSFKEKAAGLAVLVYLFEMCEVFEK